MRKTEYNYLHASAGKNDECYTPEYGIKPLIKYLDYFTGRLFPADRNRENLTIWCPFDTKESAFYEIFSKCGFKVEISDIKTGQNFFDYEPPYWDIIISNPPFTNKRTIFERALSFNKPFALLMTAAWLNDKAPCELFDGKGLQLLMFKDRMRFKNQEQKQKINFKSIYFCRDFLPRDIIIEEFEKK